MKNQSITRKINKKTFKAKQTQIACKQNGDFQNGFKFYQTTKRKKKKKKKKEKIQPNRLSKREKNSKQEEPQPVQK